MFQIIWMEVKDFLVKNIKIFLLSAVAFTFSCIAINIALTNYISARQEEAAMKESYGDKSFYKVMLSGDEEVFENFFGGRNAENIKNAFEELKSQDKFEYRYKMENAIEFFSIEDDSYGKDDFPRYSRECVYGYETGEPSEYDDYLQLKGIFADRLFSKEPNVHLESGSWFEDKDYIVGSLEDIRLPVILGSKYKDYYKLGDEIENAHIATEESITLVVAGFLKEDSYFYNNNNEKVLLNRYMIVPSVETSYDYTLENGDFDTFFKYAYDSTKIMNTRIICKKNDSEEVLKTVNQIFMKNRLYELRVIDESGSAEKSLNDSEDLALSCMVISLFIIVFSVIVYGVQMYYKILINKRKYGIFILEGLTKKQIFLLTLVDTLMVFILADILFVVFWYINSNRGFDGLGLTGYTFVLIPIMEFVILCIMGVLGVLRISRLDLSSSLRENE